MVSWLCMTLLLVTGCSGLTVNVTDITMTAKIGIRRDWSWQPCQLMGVATSPRRMYSAGCQDRLFVAWSSHKNWTASSMRTNTFVENTEAHIAEFSINSTTGKTILISDKLLEGFSEVSAVSVTPDCGIVGLIAQSDKDAAKMAKMDKDAAKMDKDAAEMDKVKDLSKDQSETSPAWTGFMYLLEWTANTTANQTANTTAPPSTKILFAKNVKGESWWR